MDKCEILFGVDVEHISKQPSTLNVMCGYRINSTLRIAWVRRFRVTIYESLELLSIFGIENLHFWFGVCAAIDPEGYFS